MVTKGMTVLDTTSGDVGTVGCDPYRDEKGRLWVGVAFGPGHRQYEHPYPERPVFYQPTWGYDQRGRPVPGRYGWTRPVDVLTPVEPAPVV